MERLLLMLLLGGARAQRREGNQACSFAGAGEGDERQVRVAEDTPPGTELFTVRAFPRRLFNIQALDGSRTDGFFTFRELDRRDVAVVLAKSLQTLVDQSSPTTAIRFRLACRGRDSSTAYLPVTVFIQDINDNPPVFQSPGYNVTIDENTPVGLTIFRGIQALDRDRPNTPNSQVVYSIVAGNRDRKFSLESGGQKAVVVLRKPLDLEAGDSLFNMTILARDRGVPPLSSTSSLLVRVRDIDDLPPRFSAAVYRASVREAAPGEEAPVTPIVFRPEVRAADQDTDLRAPLHYSITAGNDMQYFRVDPDTAQVFLTKALDLETLDGDKFSLELTARQRNSELKTATAMLEIDVVDINDNKPEFEVEQYNMTVIENLPVGFRIMQFTALDRDRGANAKFHYQLEDPSEAFGLEADGSLVLARPELFDRERMDKVVVRVLAVEEEPSVLEDTGPSSVKVEIHLLDTNDNSPVFIPSNVYVFQLGAGAAVGSVVGQVRASDLDQAENGLIRYSIKNATEDLPVTLDPETGEIKLTQRIAGGKQKISLFINAADQPANQQETRFALAVVELQLPVGEEEPHFGSRQYEWWLEAAQAEPGALVGTVRAEGLEPATYSLEHAYTGKVPMEIDSLSGVITLTAAASAHWRDAYTLLVRASGAGGVSVTAGVTVHVTRQQEESGEPAGLLQVRVPENQPGGAVVANLSLLLQPRGRQAEHLIANQEARDKFVLTGSGLLLTSGPLDREERDSYMVTIVLGRKGIIRGKQPVQLKVLVTDENDNSPVFEQHIYQGHIPENSAAGTVVLLAKPIVAVDPDSQDKEAVVLQLYGKDSDKFRLEQSTGQVILATEPLDREEKEVYYLRLRATDTAGQQGEGQLVIHVTDRNDHQPKFLKLQVLDSRLVSVAADKVWVGSGVGAPVLDMAETVPPGTRIARVLAEDLDNSRTAQLLYSLLSEEGTYQESRPGKPAGKRFAIDAASGDIIVSRQVEALTTYILNISAQDEGGLSTITQIILRINDTNNNRPVFDKSHYSLSVLEGEYEGAELGLVHAEDGDFYDNGRVTYELVGGGGARPGLFRVEPGTGAVRVWGALDREEVAEHLFTLVARDHGAKPLTSSVNVTVTILDQNDNQPLFFGYDRLLQHNGLHTVPVYSSHLNSYRVDAGVRVAEVFANDTDSTAAGNGVVEFKLTDHTNVFYIHPVSGELTTLLPIGEAYNITVQATDQGRPPRHATAEVHLTLRSLPGGGAREQPRSSGGSRTQLDKQNLILRQPDNTAEKELERELAGSQTTERTEEQEHTEAADEPEVAAEPAPSPHPLPVGQMFRQEVYSVEVEENAAVPRLLLELGREVVGGDGMPVHYRIVGSNYGLFRVEEESGRLQMTASPDREQRDMYILRVKASTNKSSKQVPLFFYTLYIEGEGGGAAGEGEAIVRVTVKDANDNRPEFELEGGEMVAAVPTNAEYGHLVTKVQAWDRDAGLNSQLRYSFLRGAEGGAREGPGAREGAGRFLIDPATGQVISTASFLGQAGASFHLQVRATDQDGSGLSSTQTLVVDVISAGHEVALLVGRQLADLEPSLANVTRTISGLAGIKVRRAGARQVGANTELRVYGVRGGALLGGQELLARLAPLPLTGLGIREVSLGQQEEAEGLGSVEVAVLTMACLVFLGAFIAVLCICCIKMKRSQKHYPAPLAIPLPNYSYDGKELDRQASQRFGTIPRVTKLHDTQGRHEAGDREHENRSSYIQDSSEDDGLVRAQSHHSTPSHRKSTRSTKGGVKSSGESSRSRDSGIDDNRDCCSCRQSSVSSRDSYGWGARTATCTRCCGCAANSSRRHRSSSPARRSCSLKPRCSHRSLPRHAHSHHDLRDDTETDSELSEGPSTGPLTRAGSAHSSRRALYTAELFSNSLTPAHSGADVRLASTTAARGHSWRGDHHPLQGSKLQQKGNTYNGTSDHISLPNFGAGPEAGEREGPRTSVRKSNLKVPSGGVRLVGLSHTARNNAMV